jgi:hypothetical protein
MACHDLAYVHQKVERRLPACKARCYRQRELILLESCMSSIPTYTMGMYLLQGELHHKMETTRGDFFWHGPNLKKKYHMARWGMIAAPKDAGGLGITDTRVMNKCLLAKWIFKLESGQENLCCNLLRAKYLGEKGFFSCTY